MTAKPRAARSSGSARDPSLALAGGSGSGPDSGPEPDVAARKAELFKALAHPVRVRVLEQLVAGERAVGDLALALAVEPSHLSQQLAVLRRAGVVSTRRTGSAVFYALRDPRTSQLLYVARQLLVSSLEGSAELLDYLRTPDVMATSVVGRATSGTS